jgi:hypothetical protein
LEKAELDSTRGLLLLIESALTEPEIQKVTESSAKAVLQKPVHQESLKRELQRLLGQ